MTKIVLQAKLADRIRLLDGPIELVDDQGIQRGVVRRPPKMKEIELARARIGSEGPRFTVDQLIEKVKAL